MVEVQIANDLAHIGNAFAALFGEGGFPVFFKELLLSFRGVGVFLVIYGLMMFISKITIFKSEEHHKYAHMFGIGIALIAISNNKVYDLLVGTVAQTFLQIILIMVVVFGIIILLNYLNKHRHEASAGAITAKSTAVSAKGEYHAAMSEKNKLKNESQAQKRLNLREKRGMANTVFTTTKLRMSRNNADALLKTMENEISRISSLQSAHEPTDNLRKSIFDKLNAFVAHLHKDNKHLKKLQKLISDLNSTNIKGLIEDKDEQKVEKSFQAHIRSLSGEKTINDDAIQAHFISAISLEKKKQQLLSAAKADIKDAERTTGDLESGKSALSAALSSGDIAAISSALSTIRERFARIKRDEDLLYQHILAISRLSDEIDNHHFKEQQLLIDEESQVSN